MYFEAHTIYLVNDNNGEGKRTLLMLYSHYGL